MSHDVLLLATIPYTGTHTMFELLQMHPDISQEILAPELTHIEEGAYNPLFTRKGKGRVPPLVLSQAKDAFCSMRQEPFALVRGHISAEWIRALLIHRPFEFTWITTYRHPVNSLTSLYRRRGSHGPWVDANPWPYIFNYQLWFHCLELGPHFVVPIEELASMTPSGRIRWMGRYFFDATGLVLTQEMCDYVASWEKKNEWQMERGLAETEYEQIQAAVNKADLPQMIDEFRKDVLTCQ